MFCYGHDEKKTHASDTRPDTRHSGKRKRANSKANLAKTHVLMGNHKQGAGANEEAKHRKGSQRQYNQKKRKNIQANFLKQYLKRIYIFVMK